nr:MAG TPA: hypothetical protein [Caudoviricetes sp.]
MINSIRGGCVKTLTQPFLFFQIHFSSIKS